MFVDFSSLPFNCGGFRTLAKVMKRLGGQGRDREFFFKSENINLPQNREFSFLLAIMFAKELSLVS